MIDHTTLKPWRVDPEVGTKFIMDADGNLVATFESRADAELACRLAAAERIQMEHMDLKASDLIALNGLRLFVILDRRHLSIGEPQKTPAEAWISAEQSQRKEGA